MKIQVVFAFLSTFIFNLTFSQATIFGFIKDSEGKTITQAQINIDEIQSAKSDSIGYFQISDVKAAKYSVTVTKANFETYTFPLEILEYEQRKDVGNIVLKFSSPNEAGVLVIDDSATDAEDGGSSMVPTVGLLGAGRDAFQSVSAFELGAYWFRPRGVDNRFEEVIFNGVPMSKSDDGRLDFNNWGGLNDITRFPLESADHLTPSEYAFGNLGGLVYYNTRASSYRKQTSLAYSLTNRSYLHRAMATYSSGISKNGWSFTVSASRRWGNNAIIDGVYQDSYAYFTAVEKKFTDRHALNFTAFGSPTYRASNSPNTQEVYDILGKNYNSYWGFQDGEERNSRIRKSFEPIFMLTDFLRFGKNTSWINTISYQTGSDARSRLDWFHASDPNPTYYRKLPSYGLLSEEEFRAQAQIDWNALYNANTLNLNNADGSPRGAVYSILEDVNEDKTINYASHLDTRLSADWKLNVNFNYQHLKSDNFRRVKDLLGARFAYNLNAFNFDVPYNADDTDVTAEVGERTQYSYQFYRDFFSLNVSSEIDFSKWNFVASVFSMYSESYRNGDYRNGIERFKNNSKGKSEVYDALNVGLKAKITYKINGKNFLVYQGTYFTLAPTLNEIFINPRAVDYFTPGVDNQIINANDLSYILRGQRLKLRISGFYTKIDQATEISRYFVDADRPGTSSSFSTLVNEAMSDISKRYVGAELGYDLKISPTISSQGAASVGSYTYTNNPAVSTFDDLNGFRSSEDVWGKANIKGYKVAGTPQKAFSFGLKYNAPKYWWLGASANFLADQYLDFSALNKTPFLYTNPSTNDPFPEATPEVIRQLTAQKKFDDQWMFNASGGRSFVFGKYRMVVSFSVNNILNNREYVTGGFEQGRNVNLQDALADAAREYPAFGPKLWYDRGRTFFTNIYLRF